MDVNVSDYKRHAYSFMHLLSYYCSTNILQLYRKTNAMKLFLSYYIRFANDEYLRMALD